MLNFFPKYFTSLAISLYFISLAAVSVLFFDHSMSFLWIMFGIAEVCGFFFFSNSLTVKWSHLSPASFIKRLFGTSLVIRIIYIIFSYYFYIEMTGRAFEYGDKLDTLGFHEEGVWVAGMIQKMDLYPYIHYISIRGSYSEIGYPFFLGILNWMSGNSILFARLFNALFSSISAVLMYKLASRHFGDAIGRMTGIFFMLMPTVIYFTGLQAKESMMIMLAIFFMQRADLLISSRKITASNILAVALSLASLFFFRTVLGLLAFLSLALASVIGSGSFVSLDRKFTIGIASLVAMGLMLGSTLLSDIDFVWKKKSFKQTENFENRSQLKGGNPYAKYLTGAVLAPIIFIIPFPTMVNIPGQENQQMIHGGNYVKNIMSFFTLLALILLYKSGLWRNHVLPLAFMVGWMVILSFSAFAHAGRFHMPALPFLLMFAAYGIYNLKLNHKNYYKWFLLFEFVAIIFWSWFKLSGRGMV